MIAKLRHFVPSSVLTNIYKSLILPYLTDGLVAWSNASKNYLNKIVLQKRVLHLIYFVDRKEHTILLFLNAKILPITFLYYEAVCKLMLNVHNDSAPSNIMKLFTRTSNIDTYTTCSSTSQLFSIKYSRLKMQKKKPFPAMICLRSLTNRHTGSRIVRWHTRSEWGKQCVKMSSMKRENENMNPRLRTWKVHVVIFS